jgi:hypothetical protein
VLAIPTIYSFFSEKPTTQQSINNSPNSINTIGQTGGKNTIINGPKPRISENLVSLNQPDGNYFKTTFSIIADNLPESGTIKVQTPSYLKMLKSNCILKIPAMMGLDFQGNQVTAGKLWTVEITTIQKAKESDFTFSIVPNL